MTRPTGRESACGSEVRLVGALMKEEPLCGLSSRQVLRAHHGVGLVKVQRVGQVLEDPHRFGTLVRRRLDFDRVHLYALKEMRSARNMLRNKEGSS